MGTDAPGRRILVLLSDGAADDAEAVRGMLPRLAEAYDCIYTIGLGAPVDEAARTGDALAALFGSWLGAGPSYDEALLRDVSAANACGGFFTAASAFELAQVYIRLRHESVGDLLEQHVGTIAQGETTEPVPIAVGRGVQELHITLDWPGSTLDLLLRDPDGRLVDGGYPGATITSGAPPVYAIVQRPRAGTWSASAFGSDVPAGGEPYGITASSRGVVQPALPNPGHLSLLAGALLVTYGVYLHRRSDRSQDAGAGRHLGRRPRHARRALLRIAEPNSAPRTVTLAGRVRVGRSRGADVVLNDPTVSRSHCELVPLPDGLWGVIDLDSTAGTYRNEQRVRRARIRPGDVVVLGDTTLMVEPTARSAGARRAETHARR
jgi:hypothetical protein